MEHSSTVRVRHWSPILVIASARAGSSECVSRVASAWMVTAAARRVTESCSSAAMSLCSSARARSKAAFTRWLRLRAWLSRSPMTRARPVSTPHRRRFARASVSELARRELSRHMVAVAATARTTTGRCSPLKANTPTGRRRTKVTRLPYVCVVSPAPSRTRRMMVPTALGERPDRQPRTASSVIAHTAVVPTTGPPAELAADTHVRVSKTRLVKSTVTRTRLPGTVRGAKLRSISVLSEATVPPPEPRRRPGVYPIGQYILYA